jgi:hypothetical protein
LSEKQTRRSASTPASDIKKRTEEKRIRAREAALLDSAKKFVRDEVDFKNDEQLLQHLQADYGLDDLTGRRLVREQREKAA